MIKVAITDDHPMMLAGIGNMLGLYEHIAIAGMYECGDALLEGLKKGKGGNAPDGLPDVLLLDIQLPDKTGNELIRIISREYPGIRVLALTSMETPYYVRDMMKHGCMGYLLKQVDHKTLVQAIEEVHAGRQYIDMTLKEAILQSALQTKKNTNYTALTKREKQVLQLISSEFTSQQIADALFVSLKTVEGHRVSLMHKLGVKNSVGMIKAAMRMGLVE